jgi:hypothetical protein
MGEITSNAHSRSKKPLTLPERRTRLRWLKVYAVLLPDDGAAELRKLINEQEAAHSDVVMQHVTQEIDRVVDLVQEMGKELHPALTVLLGEPAPVVEGRATRLV